MLLDIGQEKYPVMGGATMAFAAVDYDILIRQSQEDVWRLIEEDSEVQTYTTVILNNMPASKVGESIGLPFIVVPTPAISENRITMTSKQIFIRFDIDIYFRRIENLALIDRVRELLSANTGTFSGTYRLNQFLNSGTPEYLILPDGLRAQRFTLSVEYEWIGDPS